jgi:hypothetical protein
MRAHPLVLPAGARTTPNLEIQDDFVNPPRRPVRAAQKSQLRELTSLLWFSNGGRLNNLTEPETTGSEAVKPKRLPGSLTEALKGPLFPDLGLGVEPEA